MAYHPKTFEDFIGQKAAVRQLQMRARAAKARGVAMPHVLIHSPIAGQGKTALANLVAQELGGRLHVETEQLKGARLRLLFMDLEPGDVLFLDEIHRQFAGGKDKAEWLLQFLDRGKIPGPVGEEDAPPITLIGATTDVGKLTAPFLTRFPIQAPLVPYTDDEATQIVGKLSLQILEGLTMPSREVETAVARAACNNPRDASRILESLRDLVWAGEIEQGGADGNYPLDEALEMAGFTPDGLSSREVKYLITSLKEFKGEPVGAIPMASRLGEVKEGLQFIENRLADKGLVLFTPRGRVLTTAGLRRAQALAESGSLLAAA